MVCDSLDGISQSQANALVSVALAKNQEDVAEVFVFFVKSDSYIGAMEKTPFLIPKNYYLADFYSVTGKFVLWPKSPIKSRTMELDL
jgi:hypothetical protein